MKHMQVVMQTKQAGFATLSTNKLKLWHVYETETSYLFSDIMITWGESGWSSYEDFLILNHDY